MKTIKSISDFLNPISINTFFQSTWAKKTMVYKHIFNLPFSLKQFQLLLDSQNLSYPDIQCYSDKGEISPQLYCSNRTGNQRANKNKISQLQQNKLTIRISNLTKYSPIMDSWAKELQKVFGCDIHINAYYTNGRFKGLEAHYDPHHLFALQLQGQKVWKLGDIVIDTPSHQFMPKLNSAVQIKNEVILKRGEVLYIPPGLWHQASTPKKSLHITIGIHPPRWNDYLSQILKYSSERHPIYRTHLPLEISNGICRYVPNEKDALSLINYLKNQVSEFVAKSKIENSSTIEQGIDNGAFTDAKSFNQFYGDVWEILENYSCPLSLYVRGSFKEINPKHDPWDIDLYAVVEEEDNLSDKVHHICTTLENKYPELPRIDLSILPIGKLRNSSKYTLKRLLLHHDAILVKGLDIKKNIPQPLLNEKTAELVKNITKHFLYNHYIKIKVKNFNNTDLKSKDFQYMKSIAKGILRSGTFILIKEKQVFVRDVTECYKILIKTYPEVERELKIIKSIFKNRVLDAQNFDLSIRKIYNLIFQN